MLLVVNSSIHSPTIGQHYRVHIYKGHPRKPKKKAHDVIIELVKRLGVNFVRMFAMVSGSVLAVFTYPDIQPYYSIFGLLEREKKLIFLDKCHRLLPLFSSDRISLNSPQGVVSIDD